MDSPPGAVRLGDPLTARMRALADQRCQPMRCLMREAIEQYVAREEKRDKVQEQPAQVVLAPVEPLRLFHPTYCRWGRVAAGYWRAWKTPWMRMTSSVGEVEGQSQRIWDSGTQLVTPLGGSTRYQISPLLPRVLFRILTFQPGVRDCSLSESGSGSA